MTIITSELHIPASVDAVYDYLTRPSRWHEWHASSLGTIPPSIGSLAAGAKFEENIRTVGFRRRVSWAVVDSKPGKRWEAIGRLSDGSTLQLVYEFATHGEGTRFTRRLDYTVKPLHLRLLNATVGCIKVRRESRVALRNLRARFASAS
jgi:hypothetical protein